MLRVLRPGMRHPHIRLWEEFLRGEGDYLAEVDILFDPKAVEATKNFQRRHGLDADGWVGPQTWGKAIELGLNVLEDDDQGRAGANWPSIPLDLTPVQDKQKMWGPLKYKPAGSEKDPEAIQILGDWVHRNIVIVHVPELAEVKGIQHNNQIVGRGTEKVSVHRLVADSFVALWKEWGEVGLLDRILVWGGLWVPRFVRGSRTTLSNHSFGTAFDINAPWNGLQKVPAKLGEKGCVRELVEIANRHGWWWGGHGWPPSHKKLDGMHLEATEKACKK